MIRIRGTLLQEHILLGLAAKHAKAGQICGCPLTQLGSAGVVLSLDVWCANALTAITFRCDLLEQAAKQFVLEGIRISIPQTLVVLKEDRDLAGRPEKTDRLKHLDALSRVIPHGEGTPYQPV